MKSKISLLPFLFWVSGLLLPLPSLSKEIPYFDIISHECARYDFDPLLVASQIFVESSFKPLAESHVGARGLMQIMPDTAKGMGINLNDLWYPEQNIKVGVYYLKWCYDRWKNKDGLTRWVFAFATYHDGIGNVRRGCKRYLPAKFTGYGNLYYSRIFRNYWTWKLD